MALSLEELIIELERMETHIDLELGQPKNGEYPFGKVNPFTELLPDMRTSRGMLTGYMVDQTKKQDIDSFFSLYESVMWRIQEKLEAAPQSEFRYFRQVIDRHYLAWTPEARMAIIASGMFEGNESLKALSETALKMMDDQRRTSGAFRQLRQAVVDFIENDPWKLNPDQLTESIRQVQDEIHQYLATHSSVTLSDIQRDRVRWAGELNRSLNGMLAELDKPKRENLKTEAAEMLRSGVRMIMSADKDARPADPEGMMRTALATVLYEHVMLTGDKPFNGEREQEEIRKFAETKAFRAYFAGLSHRDMEKIANDPSMEALNGEIEKINEFRYLNKVEPHAAENYIATLSMKRFSTPGSHVYVDDDTFQQLFKGKKRLDLSMGRQAFITLVNGEMLKSGCTMEEVFDPYGAAYERQQATAKVLNNYKNMTDGDLASYAGGLLEEYVNKGVEYADRAFDEMGEITMQKLISPKYRAALSVITGLTDAGQELERGAIREALGEEKAGKLVDKEFWAIGVGRIGSAFLAHSKDAVNYDISMANGTELNGEKLFGVGSVLNVVSAIRTLNELKTSHPGMKVSEILQSDEGQLALGSMASYGAQVGDTKEVIAAKGLNGKKGPLHDAVVYANFVNAAFCDAVPKDAVIGMKADGMPDASGLGKLIKQSEKLKQEQLKAMEKSRKERQPEKKIEAPKKTTVKI